MAIGEAAGLIAPALRRYNGRITRDARWAALVPREGDVIISTPPKCGTTWSQAMLCMLAHGGPALPAPVATLSPWIDAEFRPLDEVLAALDRQAGRRVIKTHVPTDGFPLWQGVGVVAVYRHPLDVFFSLRKHAANRTGDGQAAMLLETEEVLERFLTGAGDLTAFDDDNLETVVSHFRGTLLAGRRPAVVLHYADMLADPPGTVRLLAERLGFGLDEATLAAIADATRFGAMKAKAGDFAPFAGSGFWKSDAAFFDSASSDKWVGEVSASQLALYRRRIAALVPEPALRRWLEEGGALPAEGDG